MPCDLGGFSFCFSLILFYCVESNGFYYLCCETRMINCMITQLIYNHVSQTKTSKIRNETSSITSALVFMVKQMAINHLSRCTRKPTISICENKDADQLCSNCEADQRLCFRYTVQSLFVCNPKF